MPEGIMIIGKKPTGRTKFLGAFTRYEEGNESVIELYHVVEVHYQHPDAPPGVSIPMIETHFIDRFNSSNEDWPRVYLLRMAEENLETGLFLGPLCVETVELPDYPPITNPAKVISDAAVAAFEKIKDEI